MFSYLPILLLASQALTSTIPPNSTHQGHWETLAPIPDAAIQEHCVAAIGPDIYIVGGITTVQPNQTGVPSLSQAQAYSTTTNTWRPISSFPTTINHCNAAAVNGKLYVLGGLRGDLVWDRIPDSYSYDPETDAWTELPAMPAGTERGASAVGVWRDTVFLAGGLDYLSLVNGTQATVPRVSAFDTRTLEWYSLPPLPEERDHVGGAVVGDTFFVVGGRTRGRTGVRGTVYSMDLSASRREWVARREMPTARGGLAAAAVGDKIYTFGGEGDPVMLPNGIYEDVEVYDTRRDSWLVLPPMMVPRHGTNAAVVQGRIYVPGGGTLTGAGAVNVNDVFIP